jgi:hypothetical protein
MLPANWLTEIIKIAALGVLAITFYFVIWPRIKVMLGERNADLRSMELSAEYQGSEVGDDEGTIHRGLLLRHVKAAIRNGELICLFVNDGDSVLNLQIEDDGEVTGTIEPWDHLKAGHTGSIKLKMPTIENDIVFTLRFEDEWGYVYRERYRFGADEHILRREDEVVG